VIIGPDAKLARDKNAPRPPPAKPGLLPPVVDVKLGLGDDFRFKGAGAALRLAGTLNIRSGPGQPPQGFGNVRVVNGVYEAFGAKLAIDQGILAFQGPLDNPGLNIIAMRREREVEAGVQVTGSVRVPRIDLVSSPNLPEEEKLSWLVFGHGSSTTSGSGNQAEAALQLATTGLLNKMGSSKVASGLGLNTLSLGASKTGALAGQQVVTIGKEISSKLSVGYEQSLAGIGGIVKLTYELSRNWSVALLGGSSTGLDVLYSNRFDNLGERRQRRERVSATE
jgi:translocation and assembly module TamB